MVEPPIEAKNKGKVWLLKKAVYGLWDGSRRWYMEVEKQFELLGGKKCKNDQAFFYFHDGKKLRGLVCLHVDDMYITGDESFRNEVKAPLLKIFVFGTNESDNFKFTGINFRTINRESILLDQDDYIQNMVEINIDKNKKAEDNLSDEEMKVFRKAIGQIQWAQSGTRPDLSVEGLFMSTKNKQAKIKDLEFAKRTIENVKKTKQKEARFPVQIKFKRLGHWKDLHIEGYGDASFRNAEDKVKSVGGDVILLCNDYGDAVPIYWQSKTIKQVCSSVKSAETLQMWKTTEDAIYISRIFFEIYNGDHRKSIPEDDLSFPDLGQLPVDIFTDSKTLHESVYSSTQISEKLLRARIQLIQEKLDEKSQAKIRNIFHVRNHHMLADCLTKLRASPGKLMKLLREAKIPDFKEWQKEIGRQKDLKIKDGQDKEYNQ